MTLDYGKRFSELITKKEGCANSLKLSSDEFDNQGEIPKKHRFDYGQNINPSFNFTDIPPNTKSLVLIVEDVDDPNICINWALWNISPSIKGITQGDTPFGAVVGKNFLDSNSYYGFCPLQGRHNYSFTLFALDSKLKLDPRSSINKLYNAIYQHIIDYSEITGFCDKIGEFVYA